MKNKLPLNWCECKLEDVCSLENGIKSTGLSLPLLDAKYLRGKKEAEYRNNGVILNSGDYVILVDGENSGEIFSIPQKGIMGSTFKLLNFTFFCEKKYVLYFIHSYQDLFRTNKKGAAIPHLNKEIFKNLELPVPPLAEQGRIVGKIEEMFEKIDAGAEKLKSVQEKIKQYKQSVLHSAFTGKLYKKNEWKMCTLGDIIKPIRNRVNLCKENENFIFIGMDCIKPNELNICKKYIYKEVPSSAFAFKKKDVLYGRMRSYLNKVYEAEFDGIASAEFIIFRENDNIISSYLKYILHNDTFVEYATRNASGDRPRVKFDEDLSSFSIYLPTLPEQERIVEEIEKRFEKADNMLEVVEKSLETAEKLKQSILKKAFEGKLVPQDPNDEPASVLLERIKSEKQQNEKVKGKRK